MKVVLLLLCLGLFGSRALGSESFSCPIPYGPFPCIKDCQSYWECTNWKAQKKMCPPFMFFDPKAKSCQMGVCVTCRFTVDDVVKAVSYNGSPLTVNGDLTNWQEEKFVQFKPGFKGKGEGELRIQGKVIK